MKKATPGSFKPGQSGNLNGRPPKGHSITETIRSMMDEKPEIKKNLADKILKMANEGDIVAIKLLWNYIDGQPVQKQEIEDVTPDNKKIDGIQIAIEKIHAYVEPERSESN